MRRILANAVRALIGTVLLLLGIEGTARMLDLHSGFFFMVREGNCLQRGVTLPFEFRPNCEGQLPDTTFRTNSLGLRGDQVREDGAIRILSVGDSCTWGWGVPQEEAYPAVLQRLLDERYGPGRYQVLNAGFPANTSYDGLVYLRESGLALKPTIVISGYGFNDMFRNGETQVDQYRRFRRVILMNDFLLEHSTLYRWLRWKALDRASRTVRVLATADKYAEHLGRIAALVADHGARLMMLNFLDRRLPRGRPYVDAIVNLAQQTGVPLVTYEGARLDMVHPTEAGDRILATKILAELEAAGYVGTPSAAGAPTP
jgi:lysophospholipase L1-like esterase